MRRFDNLVLSPWIILVSLAGGLWMGQELPEFSRRVAVVGDLYLDLMKMVVLPFMMSAVMLSVQRLMQEGAAGRVLLRVFLVFTLLATLAAALGSGITLAMQPGGHLPPETLDAFGVIVSGDIASTDTLMALYGTDPSPPQTEFGSLLASLVPSNIFAALAKDETLKVLVFSLLFGLAVGRGHPDAVASLDRTLQAVSQGCQTLMRWLNYLLPIVLLCTSAGQMAKTGLGPLLAMSEFVATFAIGAAIAIVGAVLIIWGRAPVSFGQVIKALRAPFAIAVATRNSAICMPTMTESLTQGLRVEHSRVELLVPLSVSLLRLGPTLYYASATLFIAQLYGLNLTPTDIALVVVASVLTGFASAGMTGVALISLTSMTCGYLGLPFEAAFVLFLAVDPICDILRTLVIVIGNMAAVTLIAPAERNPEEAACVA